MESDQRWTREHPPMTSASIAALSEKLGEKLAPVPECRQPPWRLRGKWPGSAGNRAKAVSKSHP